MRSIYKALGLVTAIGFLLTAVSIAVAVPYQEGDVFASVGLGKVNVFRADGTFVQQLDTTTGSYETTGGAFDSNGNFYVTSFTAGALTKFDNSGVFQANLATGLPSLESVVFNQADQMYVGRADGDRDIRKYDTSGNLLDQFDVGTESRGSDWGDLAADQTTYYYTSEGRLVKRYDLSTHTQLVDFATLPGSGNAFAMRLLGDGGLLVADRSNIKRLDSGGNVIQTYDAAGEDFFFAMNLDPDGASFWSGGYSTGDVYRFRISDGALLTSFDTGNLTTLAGLAVFGEETQDGGTPPIPEPTTVLLLGLGLAGVAAGRIVRRRK
jgi:outer membrane protein assembly factor BamB